MIIQSTKLGRDTTQTSRWLLIILMFVFSVSILWTGGALAMDEPPSTIVAELLSEVVREGYSKDVRAARVTAWAQLDALPIGTVMQGVSELLHNDPKFQEDKWRAAAYRLLGRREAERLQQGRQLLIGGLRDPSINTRRGCLDPR